MLQSNFNKKYIDYKKSLQNNSYYPLVITNDIEKISLLIKQYNTDPQFILEIASYFKSYDVVDLILENYKIKVDFNLLSNATSTKIIKKLLDYTDKNIITEKLIHFYIANKSLPFFKVLIEDNRVNSEQLQKLYKHCCMNGNLSYIKTLLSTEKWKNRELENGFYLAGKKDHYQTFLYLLKLDFINHSFEDNKTVKMFIKNDNQRYLSAFFKKSEFHNNMDLLCFAVKYQYKNEIWIDYWGSGSATAVQHYFLNGKHEYNKTEEILIERLNERTLEIEDAYRIIKQYESIANF